MYGPILDLQAFLMQLPRVSIGLAAAFLASAALASTPAPAKPGKSPAQKTSPYKNRGHSEGAALYNTLNWGVDNLEVRKTSSGALIRFSYRVVDVAKAKVDRKSVV